MPIGKEEGAHLDGDAKNNHLENLAWVSKKENESHKIAHGTINIGEKNPNAKLTWNAVEYIRKHYYFVNGNKSNGAALAKKFGVTRKIVSMVATNQTWKKPTKGASHER